MEPATDFGTRLAERTRPPIRAAGRLGRAGSVGLVGRSTLGFARIVASAGSARPVVSSGNLASLTLRPPRGVWSMQPAEAEPAPPRPSWTASAVPERTVRRAPAPVAATPRRPRPAPDRKIDALRRLLERTGRIEPTADSGTFEPAPAISSDPGTATGGPPAIEPGDRRATTAGPTTAPGQLARRSRPEPTAGNERLADVLPDAAPGGGAPRRATTSGMEGFRDALAARGMLDRPGTPAADRPRDQVQRRSAPEPARRAAPARSRTSPSEPDAPHRRTDDRADDADPERAPSPIARRLPLSIRADAPDRLATVTRPIATDGAGPDIARRSAPGADLGSPGRAAFADDLRPAAASPGVDRPAPPPGVPTEPASGRAPQSAPRSPAAPARPAAGVPERAAANPPLPTSGVADPTPPAASRPATVAPAVSAPGTTQPASGVSGPTPSRPSAATPVPVTGDAATTVSAGETTADGAGLAATIRRSLADLGRRHGVPHTRSDRRRAWSPVARLLAPATAAAVGPTQPVAGSTALPVVGSTALPGAVPGAAVARTPGARAIPPGTTDTARRTPAPDRPTPETIQGRSAPGTTDTARRTPAADRPTPETIQGGPAPGTTDTARRTAAPERSTPGVDRARPPARSTAPAAGDEPATSVPTRAPTPPGAPAHSIERVEPATAATVAPPPVVQRTSPTMPVTPNVPANPASTPTPVAGRSAPPRPGISLPRPGEVLARRPSLGTDASPTALRRALAAAVATPTTDTPPTVAPRPGLVGSGRPADPAAHTSGGQPVRRDARATDDAPRPADRAGADTSAPTAPAVDGASDLAARFLAELGRAPAAKGRPMPTPFQPLARAIAPAPERVRVSTDATSRRALRSVGKRAATVGDTIHLADTPRPGRAANEVLAHELTHVAHPSPVPRFFDDDHRGPEERLAERVATVIARGPVSPGAPAPSRTQSRSAGQLVRRSPEPGAGGITAEALAARLTGGTAGSAPSGSSGSASAARTIRRAPAPDAAPADSPPTAGAGDGATSDGDTGVVGIDEGTFERLLEASMDLIIRRVEQRIDRDLVRRGGRHWRTPW